MELSEKEEYQKQLETLVTARTAQLQRMVTAFTSLEQSVRKVKDELEKALVQAQEALLP